MEINVEINKKWFEENKQIFLEKFNQYHRSEKEDHDTVYRITYSNADNCREALSEKQDNVRFVGGDWKKIWIDVEHKPTIQELLRLGTIISKYYNKAKSAIESLS